MCFNYSFVFAKATNLFLMPLRLIKKHLILRVEVEVVLPHHGLETHYVRLLNARLIFHHFASRGSVGTLLGVLVEGPVEQGGFDALELLGAFVLHPPLDLGAPQLLLLFLWPAVRPSPGLGLARLPGLELVLAGALPHSGGH